MNLPKSSFTTEIGAVADPNGPGTTKVSQTAGNCRLSGGHENLGKITLDAVSSSPLLAAWGVYRHNVGADCLLHPPVTPFVRLVGQLLLKAERRFA
jgi:hypothetical protein